MTAYYLLHGSKIERILEDEAINCRFHSGEHIITIEDNEFTQRDLPEQEWELDGTTHPGIEFVLGYYEQWERLLLHPCVTMIVRHTPRTGYLYKDLGKTRLCWNAGEAGYIHSEI